MDWLLPRTNRDRLNLGSKGEKLAQEYIRQNGYKILELNYRKSFGEVDIIALHQGDIVFIEVKTRRSDNYGSPFEAVGRKKQGQLVKIAQNYLISNGLTDSTARFDVVGVHLRNDDKPQITLITNAFELAV